MLKLKRYPLLPALAAIVLLAIPLTASQSCAEEQPSDETHVGFFIGINAGFGNYTIGYEQDSQTIFEDETKAAMGGLRLGYAFSPKIALSLEGFGLGPVDDEDEDLGVGVGILAVTWHPCSNGFFVRVGVGSGGGTFRHPVTAEKITIEEKGAALFSLGYDWYLGERTSLGLSFDHMVIDIEGATGFDEDFIGAGGLTLQFNWYL